MCTRKSVLAAICGATLVVLIPLGARAWSTQTNYLTFNGAVALPGVTLAPGTYVFRMPSEINANVVQVQNKDGSKVFFTGLTQPVDRPKNIDPGRLVIMGEQVPGRTTPIRVWFPMGERSGHAFLYER